MNLQLIKPEDLPALPAIGSALGNLGYLGGWTKRYYSLAEHSVHLAALAEVLGADDSVQRLCFLRCAYAALIGRPSRAQKRLLGDRWARLERDASHAIWTRYLPDGAPSPDARDQSDILHSVLLRYELEALSGYDICGDAAGGIKPGAHIKLQRDELPQLACWTPHTAGQRWIAASRELGL